MSNELLELKDLQGEPRYLKKMPIYPVRMKDSVEFYDCARILNIPKNQTDNIEILKMSYLKFLIMMLGEAEMRNRFFKLLNLTLRTEDIEIFEKDNGKLYIIVDSVYEISEFDFSKFRTIVCEQNLVELEDESIHPDLRAKLKESEEFMARRSNKMADLKQRILSYQYEMKLPLSEILDMTIFQFNSSLEVITHIKQADIYQYARFAGSKTFKEENKLPTWLSAIERNKENPLLLDADKLTKDMQSTFGSV